MEKMNQKKHQQQQHERIFNKHINKQTNEQQKKQAEKNLMRKICPHFIPVFLDQLKCVQRAQHTQTICPLSLSISLCTPLLPMHHFLTMPYIKFVDLCTVVVIYNKRPNKWEMFVELISDIRLRCLLVFHFAHLFTH